MHEFSCLASLKASLKCSDLLAPGYFTRVTTSVCRHKPGERTCLGNEMAFPFVLVEQTKTYLSERPWSGGASEHLFEDGGESCPSCRQSVHWTPESPCLWLRKSLVCDHLKPNLTS